MTPFSSGGFHIQYFKRCSIYFKSLTMKKIGKAKKNKITPSQHLYLTRSVTTTINIHLTLSQFYQPKCKSSLRGSCLSNTFRWHRKELYGSICKYFQKVVSFNRFTCLSQGTGKFRSLSLSRKSSGNARTRD